MGEAFECVAPRPFHTPALLRPQPPCRTLSLSNCCSPKGLAIPPSMFPISLSSILPSVSPQSTVSSASPIWKSNKKPRHVSMQDPRCSNSTLVPGAELASCTDCRITPLSKSRSDDSSCLKVHHRGQLNVFVPACRLSI